MKKFNAKSKEHLAEVIKEGKIKLVTKEGARLYYDESKKWEGKSPYRIGSFGELGDLGIKGIWSSLDEIYYAPDALSEATREKPVLAWCCDREEDIGKERCAVMLFPNPKGTGYLTIMDVRWEYARLVVNDDCAKEVE